MSLPENEEADNFEDSFDEWEKHRAVVDLEYQEELELHTTRGRGRSRRLAKVAEHHIPEAPNEADADGCTPVGRTARSGREVRRPMRYRSDCLRN